MKKVGTGLLIASVVSFASGPISAQVPLAVTGPSPISLDLGIEAARAAIRECESLNSKATVVISDLRGLSVVLSEPGTSPEAFNIALKEIGVVMRMNATGGVGVDTPIPKNGAIPIFKIGGIVNVIAVAGAMNSETDQRCAEAGLYKIADRLK